MHRGGFTKHSMLAMCIFLSGTYNYINDNCCGNFYIISNCCRYYIHVHLCPLLSYNLFRLFRYLCHLHSTQRERLGDDAILVYIYNFGILWWVANLLYNGDIHHCCQIHDGGSLEMDPVVQIFRNVWTTWEQIFQK